MFAVAGYEFVGIDQRGFGHSGGTRGRFESIETTLNNVHAFNVLHKENMSEDDKRLPCFIMGNSLGGQIATHLAVDHKDFYQGAILTVPYFDMKNKRLLEKLQPFISAANLVSPDKSISMRLSEIRPHVKEWKEDPMNLGAQITPHNVMV